MLKRVQNAATNRARIVRNALRRVVLNRTKRARGTMAGNRLNNIVRYYIEKKPVPPVRGLRVKLPLPGPATLSLQLKAAVAATKAKKKYFINANLKSLSTNLNSKNFFKGVPIAKIGTNSVNGAIFAMQMNNGSRKVLKIIHHPLGKSEYTFQKKAAGISPQVYQLKTGIELTPKYGSFFKKSPPNNKINAFLMNNLQKNATNTVLSLKEFFGSASNANKTKVFNMLKAKVSKLSNLGIEHANLHEGNAYVIIKPDGSLDVMIIDYGRSKNVGMATRSYISGKESGKVSQRFGGLSKNYPAVYGPIYQTKKSVYPVILNRNKLAKMKTNYGII